MNSNKTETYSYNPEDFAILTKEFKDSYFDKSLKVCWEDKMIDGLFRYALDDLRTRIIPGKYGFVAQLNIKRATDRRKPEFISSITMPFDCEKFHFGKVDQKEIICLLLPKHWEQEEAGISFEQDRHALLINVSPLEECNSLLVPYIDKFYPQVLDYKSLQLAIEVMLLSHNQELRVGMNSLGGYASVNHLHFHLYYLKETLYLQHCPVKHLCDACYEIVDYPAEGFVFQLLDPADVSSISKKVMSVVGLLQMKEIAYNIFMTRGKAFNDISSEETYVWNAIRIFIWARKPSFGIKEDTGFNPAMCELAGHLPIKEENYFKSVKEDDIASILREITHETFVNARAAILQHDNLLD